MARPDRIGSLNFAAAREAMVESQVRPNGITDRRIIEAMASIAREDFVPEASRQVAYMDGDIPFTKGPTPRCMIEAMALARLVQLAKIEPTDRILHVGAATGYGTAILARLGAAVVALESDASLAASARENLRGLVNVTVVEGPLTEGAKAMAPYDVILIEGRIGELPQSLSAQAAEAGRIVAVIGEFQMAKAQLWTVRKGAATAGRTAFDASIAPLPGFDRSKASFVF